MKPEPDSSNRRITDEAKADRDGIDYRLFVALRTRCHPVWLEKAVAAFSTTGNYGIFWLALTLAFWVAGAPRGMFIFLPAAMYLTLAVNYSVKVIMRRERPVHEEPRLKPLVGVPSSHSFPSSHAAMSFVAAGVMTFFAPAGWALFYGLALLMSWSRVYVGVHYPSDVVAGTAVGAAMSILCLLFLVFAV